MDSLEIQERAAGLRFSVKVVPGSRRTAIVGLLDGALKVKIAAPAEKGRANRQLIDYLAKQLAVKASAIAIRAGQTNPLKQLEVAGISVPELRRRLGLAE